MTDNRNTIIAVVLSGLVLLGWQYFYNIPQMEKQKAQQATQAQLANPSQPAPGATSTTPQPGSAPTPGGAPVNAAPANAPISRDAALASSKRVKIDTRASPARSRCAARASTISRSPNFA